MGVTLPDNIPFPDPGTSLTPLETHFAAVAEGAQAMGNAIRGATSPSVPSQAARTNLYPTPVQGNSVYRLDLGVTERYFSEYSATGNPGGATPAGWYAVSDGGPVVGTFTYGALYQNHALWEPLTLTRRGRNVRLKGTATIKQTVSFVPATGYILGTIPADFRPPKGVFTPLSISPATGGWLAVNTSGNVEFALSAATTQAANAMLLGINAEWELPASA